MKTIIYHNPRCSKSREALCMLEEEGADIHIIEYLKETPNEEELADLIKMLGIKPFDLIRKSEDLYKLKYKDKKKSPKEWIKVMVKNPVLIERPIVVKENQAIIGRPPILVKDLL
ncbi:arsenate reductase (glutaredoxin) [Fluviicola taffensis]|uniref:Arsenate reductase n=1 Tax=Fluviicola taffensis (strain DSM 16823 / NCIMB 13979 / RW262) TaxID=755732 RepID=F2IJN2_FLUTR|nr:arsenate reductase (glutaredoxin) [Fluviicola taffensis]AEA43922.1 arsenate reductase [Fluviicola taffensis DSM 16823]